MLKCEVDGALNMKSYLTGSPEIRMGLNQELVIGRQASSGGTVAIGRGVSDAAGGRWR